MNAWLYQMALRKEWSPEDYRVEVWEGQEVTWPSGKLTGAEGDKVIPGDVIFLFFAQTHNVSPGIYGVGIITRYSPGRGEITFRVCPPSDHLKTDPLWDDNVKQAIPIFEVVLHRGRCGEFHLQTLSGSSLAFANAWAPANKSLQRMAYSHR